MATTATPDFARIDVVWTMRRWRASQQRRAPPAATLSMPFASDAPMRSRAFRRSRFFGGRRDGGNRLGGHRLWRPPPAAEPAASPVAAVAKVGTIAVPP